MTGPAAGLLARSRVFAARLMVDDCEIRAPSTLGPMDPVTGRRPTVPGVLRYSGPCKIQVPAVQASVAVSGGHTYSLDRYLVHIPDTVQVFAEDEVKVTASVKAWNVGRLFRVVGSLDKTFQSANRLQVTEIAA